ncbi:MAG: sterol desaturase family protein [Candidatus Thermoplasmatota archaeon]|nr:sterol desaturase family protein [Candidatus Thermoplasmatota archaeon]
MVSFTGFTATFLLYAGVVLLTFLFMEFVAWFLHKYVMHGFGWFLHEDHHRYTKGHVEKNDVFGLIFSLISFLLIFTGWLGGFDIRFAFGIGVMMYGLGYFLVHDVFFHRRIKIKYRPKSRYMKRVLHAHTVHHQKSKAHEGICFGFLYASKKYEVKE